jgi:hypothetical protein
MLQASTNLSINRKVSLVDEEVEKVDKGWERGDVVEVGG